MTGFVPLCLVMIAAAVFISTLRSLLRDDSDATRSDHRFVAPAIFCLVWVVVACSGAVLTPRSHLYAMVDVDLIVPGGVWCWGAIGFAAACLSLKTTSLALTSPWFNWLTSRERVLMAVRLAAFVGVGVVLLTLLWITRKPAEIHSYIS